MDQAHRVGAPDGPGKDGFGAKIGTGVKHRGD